MIRTLLILPLTVLLSGCVVLDAFLMSPYDSGEYQAITAIRTTASISKEQCDDREKSVVNANTIAAQTQYFEFYEEKISRNENGYKAAKALNEIAQSLKDRYAKEDKVSTIYCQTKFKSIEVSSNLIQQTVGDRPK